MPLTIHGPTVRLPHRSIPSIFKTGKFMSKRCRDYTTLRGDYRRQSLLLCVLELRQMMRAKDRQRRMQRTPKPENAAHRLAGQPKPAIALRDLIRMSGML